jgi:hypothetical protein
VETEQRLSLPEDAAEALTIYRRRESQRSDQAPLATPSGGDLWHRAV